MGCSHGNRLGLGGQAGFISKPGLRRASDLVLIDLVQGSLNYYNGSLQSASQTRLGSREPLACTAVSANTAGA